METFFELGTVVVKFIPKWCPAWWRALLGDSSSPRGPPRCRCLRQQSPHRPPSDSPRPPSVSRTLQHSLAWHSRAALGDGTAPARLPGPGSYFLFRSASGRGRGSARSLRSASPGRRRVLPPPAPLPPRLRVARAPSALGRRRHPPTGQRARGCGPRGSAAGRWGPAAPRPGQRSSRSRPRPGYSEAASAARSRTPRRLLVPPPPSLAADSQKGRPSRLGSRFPLDHQAVPSVRVSWALSCRAGFAAPRAKPSCVSPVGRGLAALFRKSSVLAARDPTELGLTAAPQP